ncbi:MAG: superoxide dismutase [Deltaproteobacteria bacterium]|nr:superoxide dismutase [Deltaproteobacteria bacterium]
MYHLPELTYDYDALEPYIDAKTMEIHYTKHHQAYIDKLNKAFEKYPDLDLANKPIEDLLRNIESVPENIRTSVRNNGGGHANHSFFWTILGKKSELHAGPLADAISRCSGSMDEFKKEFATAATDQFGSGVAWLVLKRDHSLEVLTTSNQDSPLLTDKVPILGLDVWEHAYYLKYQNRRPEYIMAFWNVIHWPTVEKRFLEAINNEGRIICFDGP